MRVGFISIGNMGHPMAANVAQAGFPLTIYDLDPGCTRRFAEAHPGCRIAEGLGDLGLNADVAITMLPTGADVRGCCSTRPSPWRRPWRREPWSST